MVIGRDGKNINHLTKKNTYKNRFPSKYIVSFAQVSGDDFLFGGIFEILENLDNKYKVKLTDFAQTLIGRLVVTCEGGTKINTTFTPNSLSHRLTLKEIYPTKYNGETFKGINLINHDYSSLEVIFKNQLTDWKSALSKVKGIYLLTNKETGKNYVGSASGENGIWGRWSEYIFGLTGGNKKLVELVKEEGEEYFKSNFKFTVLETVGSIATEDDILKLESLWKDKLLSRKDRLGYNEN
ncbi:MAG: GIY-YIG nuclease family protein [Fusobacterium sp.]